MHFTTNYANDLVAQLTNPGAGGRSDASNAADGMKRPTVPLHRPAQTSTDLYLYSTQTCRQSPPNSGTSPIADRKSIASTFVLSAYKRRRLNIDQPTLQRVCNDSIHNVFTAITVLLVNNQPGICRGKTHANPRTEQTPPPPPPRGGGAAR